ncbi:hypothetical protein BpHYR1_014929, partial [Brachionus plicatilis]
MDFDKLFELSEKIKIIDFNKENWAITLAVNQNCLTIPNRYIMVTIEPKKKAVALAELKNYVNLTFEANLYEAIIGESIKMTCKGQNLSPADIVWIVYSIKSPFEQRVIFSDNIYIGNSSRKYSIETELISDDFLTTSLNIHNVDKNDELFGYQCVCNIYKRCSTTNHAKANASIVAVMLTTPSKLDAFKPICLFGVFNTIQYSLVIFCFCVLLVTTFMFHFSSKRKLFEKILTWTIVVICVLGQVMAILLWIKHGSSNESVSVYIISIMLVGCIILWTLNLQSAIRLNLKNDLKTMNLVLIVADTVMELLSSILLVLTNSHCSGFSLLIPLKNFDYSYLEIISASLLLLFAILLFIISSIIFYFNFEKQKKEMTIVQPIRSNESVFITNNIINPTINNSENKIIEASISSIERSMRFFGKNIVDDYRSNSSSLSNVKLEHSVSFQDNSEANLLEKDFNRGCLSNLDHRSLAMAKRTKSNFSNYDKLKNESFYLNSG